MDLSRRSFLKGTLAVTATAVTGLPAMAAYPVLHGDGIHDDTAALQALFDGKKVVCENEVIQVRSGESVYLNGGEYRISATLRFGGDRPFSFVEHAKFTADMDPNLTVIDARLRSDGTAAAHLNRIFISRPESGFGTSFAPAQVAA